MELHTAAFLSRAGLRTACKHYLDVLGIDPRRKELLLGSAAVLQARNASEVFAALHQAIAEEASGQIKNSGNRAYVSVRGRLKWAVRAIGLEPEQVTARDRHGRARLLSTPPHNRASMAPQRYSAIAPATGQWRVAAMARRLLLALLVLGQSLLATQFMAVVLPYGGRQPLEMAILALFGILFVWISLGFWTAIAGFFLVLFGKDEPGASLRAAREAPIAQDVRTAIIMPICNESVPRVFAGLRATCDSLVATGEADRFDFFVLSDSSEADSRVAETRAWLDMCRDVGPGRVFYRWRRHRIKKKSGNVADFCRRWGRNYRYMVVMDADSVMSGDCITRLVGLMEANPTAGIIQTAPRAVGRETLYARLQQFAIRAYGALYTAGLHFWQLGESYYWGHNAIIRVAPFMRYCALARLPGRGPLSGEILSHDFVEAALMRRAGWSVWIAYDLPGSYEQVPPNLIDELQRDRRWCQGNLMNFRLFFMRGLHPTHRAMFLIGVMAYVSAPLWFASLILSTILLAVHTLLEPRYFVQPYQLFPLWPEWRPGWALLLFSTTAVLLFLPKLLAVLMAVVREGRRYGGGWRMLLSMALEFLFSVLLAPIRMLFHTQFVITALSGWGIRWKSPPREDAETTWTEALQRHGWHTLVGLAWAALVYWLDPSYLWWLLPVVGALALSIPLSAISSRIFLGRRLRRASLLMIPEEFRPPKEMRWARKYLRRPAPAANFAAAVVDPVLNALMCASGVARLPSLLKPQSEPLVRKALVEGPHMLSSWDKAVLLADSLALSQLHFQVWSSPEAHAAWSSCGVAHSKRSQVDEEQLPGMPHSMAQALQGAAA